MPGRKLLLVTVDPALAILLPQQLAQGTDFTAEVAPPEEGRARLTEMGGRIDATLLDAAVPQGPSAWGPVLREAGGGRPVLLLGQAADEDRPEVLPPGISGRVSRPIRLPDLVARLHALLATFEASPEAAIPLGDYAFHPAAKLMLTPAGRRIRLTEKEAAILLYLHRTGGRAVTRAELLGEVWGYSSAVTTHTLETHIYRLRRKIEPEPQAAKLLLTEEGGYRLGA